MKQSLPFVAALGVLILLGAGCGAAVTSNSSSSTQPNRTASDNLRDEDKNTEDSAGDPSQVPAAEALIGFDLPEDAGIRQQLDNPNVTSVIGRTSLSVEEARVFFDAQLQQKNFRISRNWGVSPFDGENIQTVVAQAPDGALWAIFIRAEGDLRTFQLDRTVQ